MNKEYEEQIFANEVPHLRNSEFYECEFLGLDFCEEDFANAKFIECKFSKCNLSNIGVTNASFRECAFNNCKLVGINWSASNSIADLKFKECSMDYSVFQDLNLRSFEYVDCSLKEGDFLGSILEKATFKGSDLNGATISNCDLRGCDFRAAINYLIDVRENKIKKAKFSLPEGLSLIKLFEVDLE